MTTVMYVRTNGQERVEVREDEIGGYSLWSPRRGGWVTPESGPYSCTSTGDYNVSDYETEEEARAALLSWANATWVNE